MIIVFAGPTIDAAEVAAKLEPLEHRVLPPVSQGDVWRVGQERPWGIAIIDGLFDSVPAVWHKEILWAMSEGIHVFGAASMGALRAAELDTFGMVGVGAIYEAFTRGDLERDDEVTIIHASAEHGYRPLSVALVDIRATMASAVDGGVASVALAVDVIEAAAGLYYKERTWARVFDELRERGPRGVDDAEVITIRAWVDAHPRSAKREDAVALLEYIGRARVETPAPFEVGFELHQTEFWHQAQVEAGRRPMMRGAQGLEAILDELRLEGEASYREVYERGCERALAADAASRAGIVCTPALRERTAAQVRDEHGLGDDEAFEAWRAERALDGSRRELERMLMSEANLRCVRESLTTVVGGHMSDVLRLEPGQRYGELARRAEAKRMLTSEPSTFAELGIDRDGLLRWYYEGQRGRPVPSPSELESIAARLGLDHVEVWLQILRCDYEARSGPAVHQGM